MRGGITMIYGYAKVFNSRRSLKKQKTNLKNSSDENILNEDNL